MLININIMKVNRLNGILFALLLSWNLLSGQNNTLHFDGGNDFITLNPVNGFAPNDDFTVEMFFTVSTPGIACASNFRRLFALASTSGPASRFEVGECGGDLRVFWQNAVGSSVGVIPVPVTPTLGTGWHHIAVVRNGNSLEIFLDCISIWTNSGNPTIGTPNTGMFVVGHWGGGNTTNQDWEGEMDDIRLWNVARTAVEIAQGCQSCVLICNEPNLIAYWRLDEGNPGLSNIGITNVLDCTSNGNNGVLSLPTLTPAGFLLNGQTSNFVTSTSPLLYPEYTNSDIYIYDPLQTVALSSICSGDAVHFSIYSGLAGNIAQAGAGTTVQWYYSDDCFANNSLGTLITPGAGALFNEFAFVVPPGHPATTASGTICSPNAFVDRSYRAIITVTDGTNICTYTTASFCSLRICCQVQNALLNIAPSPIAPLTTFCEGDAVQFNVILSSNMPQPNSLNNVHISWSVMDGGNTILLTGPTYDDQISINYFGPPLSRPNICFKATISNCGCTPITVQHCITVDPKPMCGTITGASSPATLIPDPDLNPDHYVICPGDDAAVEVVLPFTTFTNCDKVWQYMFTSGSSPGVWKDLGTSNTTQNTNVLPHLKPATSPYLWPPGETCINYRIECRPYNYPNSGCPSCHSNEVRICLKQEPPAPVITASPNPICKGSFSLLSVQTPDPNCNYEWYCNGLLVGFGDFFNASQDACYWVTCNDGCYTVTSNKVCLDVCQAVAIIKCPLPICPCVGDIITLSAVNSYSTCGGALTYVWSWNGGTLIADNGITLDHIPDANGTIYTLTVIDANGCTDTFQTFIKPCSS